MSRRVVFLLAISGTLVSWGLSQEDPDLSQHPELSGTNSPGPPVELPDSPQSDSAARNTLIQEPPSADGLEFYPWVDASEYHRIPKTLLKDLPIRYWSGSPGGKEGIVVSKECAWLFGMDRPTVESINQLLADAYHEFRKFEGRHMQPIEVDQANPGIRRGDLNKVLEAHTFKLVGPVEQIRASVRGKLKQDIHSILDPERAKLVWLKVGTAQPDHIADYYTYQLDDLGTELNIRRYPTFRGRISGQYYPEEWDRHAPTRMVDVLKDWRRRVRESLSDTDERKVSVSDSGPEDYSILDGASRIRWTPSQPFFKIPKSMIASALAPGLDASRQISPTMIAVLGLDEDERDFVMTQFRRLEDQFQQLEKEHFHPIDDPEYNYQLDAFPDQAETLKKKWLQILASQFGHLRATLIDKFIRRELSRMEFIKARIKVRNQNPDFLNRTIVTRDPVWLNQGIHSIRMHVSIHQDESGAKRCDLRFQSEGENGSKSNATFQSLEQPFRHLIGNLLMNPDAL